MDLTVNAPAATEVLVVGAGIAGSALAYELSRRGVATLLVDQGASGPAGASTVPAALINPHRGRTARAASADVAGATAFWELARDLAGDLARDAAGNVARDVAEDGRGHPNAALAACGAHPSGVLRIADNARQARAWQKLEGPRWLEPSEVPPAYHAPFGALLVESGGWLESRKLLAALVRGAERRSATAWWGAEFVGVEQLSAGLAGAPGAAKLAASLRLHGAASERVLCRAVVIATGAWQPERLRLPRFEYVWGEASVLELGSTPPYPVAGAVVAAFQEGRAMLSGGHRSVSRLGAPPGPDTQPSAPSSAPQARAGAPVEAGPDLRAALAWHVPAAAAAPELARWEGVRAKRPSGEPVARRLCPGVYLLAAFGGRGFLRAAAVASRLADGLTARLA